MAVTGCARPCFLVFNFFFWCIGMGLIGFMAWTIATNPALSGNFVSGTRYFTYTVLGAGILIGITGLVGCIGGASEGSCLIKTFLCMTIAVVLIEIAGAIVGYAMSDKMSDLRDSGWQDFNEETKDFIQTNLQCCGFSNFTEYGDNQTSIPDSCFGNTTNSLFALYEDACWIKMKEWLDGNMPIWIGVIAGVVVLEIAVIVLALVMLNRITEAVRVTHEDRQGRGRPGQRGGGGGGRGRGGHGGGGGGGGKKEAFREYQDRKEIRDFEMKKKFYKDAGGRYTNFPHQ